MYNWITLLCTETLQVNYASILYIVKKDEQK